MLAAETKRVRKCTQRSIDIKKRLNKNFVIYRFSFRFVCVCVCQMLFAIVHFGFKLCNIRERTRCLLRGSYRFNWGVYYSSCKIFNNVQKSFVLLHLYCQAKEKRSSCSTSFLFRFLHIFFLFIVCSSSMYRRPLHPYQFRFCCSFFFHFSFVDKFFFSCLL